MAYPGVSHHDTQSYAELHVSQKKGIQVLCEFQCIKICNWLIICMCWQPSSVL